MLYGRVAAVIAAASPGVATADRQALVQAIAAGHVSATTVPDHKPVAGAALALASFAEGARRLFLAGALFMTLATLLTWLLVSADEARPAPAGRAALALW